MNFKAVLKLFSILALKMSVVLTSAHETDKPSFPTECSEVPHRVRFRCYATQLIQGAGGVRSRGRVLKEGLPPVFDYETDNTREVDKTTKAESVQASAPKDAQDVDGKADPGPSAKQAMVTQEAETLQSGNATDMEIEKDWIVVWDESQVSSKDIRDVCASGLAGTNKTCQREYSTAVTGFSAHLTLNELEGVLSEHSARIKYAERDQVFSATMMNQTTNLPWGLDRIDSRYGRSGSYQYLNTGEGVNIYVLDTGVRITHEQFGYLNGSAGSRAQSGYDFIDDDSNADDCTGHGTHVAGTVAGKDYGVAKDARVHSVRVLDCYGSASTQAVIAGIDWTETNHIKPAVATMSLGGPASVSLDEATAALVAAGVTVAVAAGNDDWNACYNSPAREPTAITVGASDEYDSGATFTNYGSCVDLFAPGTNILSSHYGSDNGALTKSGTSMATPYVAGVAALYLQSNPSASPMELKNEVLNDATTNVLSSLGAGSPNKLLYSIVYPVSTAPTVVTSTPTGSPTSPTTSPSSAPTSPTTSPTAAPTSPTVSPTTMSPTYPPPTNSPTETDPVPGVVTAFASFAPSVISGFRNLENFTGGESGKCMNGFFYCGNMIYAKDIATSRYAGPLPYRQSTSAAASLAGDITYTTYKSTSGGHLWLGMLYSPTASIDSIKIDGEAYVYYNARRYGGISRGSLGVSTVDSRYSGWYYKVATRYRPSINHLIIAEGSSWTHSSYTSGNYYYQHTLRKTGRTSASRLYYLLWVGAQTNSNYRNGYSYSSNDFRNVMNAFLHVIGTTASPTSDTATPTWSPTPKTASPSAAPTSPTSPTTPPSSSPTPSSTSPTVVTPTSCAEYMYLGYTTSGVYTISAKAGSGLPDRSMYCDMEEDGGGWMLLYSYNRNWTTYMDLSDATLPTSPTTGYSHWHLYPALGYTSADDVLDVRFYCSTSSHSRVVHFKTSDYHIRRVALMGRLESGNYASNWNTGWTALSNHSAYLPAAVTYGRIDRAFYNYPFYGGGAYWMIQRGSTHCDDNDMAERSSHQVWVRLSGPTRAPTYAPTSPTTTPTAAPTSPTTSPTTAPTSPTASPTVVIPASCAEYLLLGHNTSGVYTIRSNHGSGLPDRSVYCDMEEEGGGWMLLYSYNRSSTTASKSLISSRLPTSPTTGYSHWHLGQALGYWNAGDVAEVRFYCRTSLHSRVIHFKTSNEHIRGVAVSGNHRSLNSPSHWNTGWTALSNHSAFLPAHTAYTANAGGFYGSPFYGNNVRWAINSWNSYCDNNGEAGNYSHKVWVRVAGPTIAPTSSPTSPTTAPTRPPTSPTMAPTTTPTSKTLYPTVSPTTHTTSPTITAPTSCVEYMSMGNTTSGVYVIGAKAGSGLPSQNVYCDMEEDGGGWMLIYSYNRKLTTSNRGLETSSLPTSPTNGYSHWHLGPALGYTSNDDVAEVRFYCSTSSHSRVVHFKTSNQHVRRVAVTGGYVSGMSPASWNTGWTALANHSAYLPADTSSTNNYNFLSSPFAANNVAWRISSSYTYCDDNDQPEQSTHQVWVRLAGLTDSPTSAPTSPTSSPTIAPTSPTAAPTTPAPTATPPTSCAEYLRLGHAASGIYTISAKDGSGRPDRSVYCDMEEDGGGWMLLYSYNRNLTTSKSLDGSHLPTSPTTGYSHWHLGPALGYWSADDVLDVRFYCSTSSHSRVMHFKTSNRYVRKLAVSGSSYGNSPSYWNTGWTGLSNHTAYLPADTTSGASYADLYNNPFYGNNVQWVISNSYARCDDNGGVKKSSHQIWVRFDGLTASPTTAPTSPTESPTAAPTSPTASPTTRTPTTRTPTTTATASPTGSPTVVPAASCAEHLFRGHTSSGVYTVTSRSGSGLPRKRVYCDMEEDGGGWMLLYSYNRNLTTSRGLNSWTLPTSPTTGYSHSHLGSALGYTNANDVLDVRFFCTDSFHSRVVHFKTSNRHIRGVAVSGSQSNRNSPSHWNTGWTALSGHSGYLPAGTTSVSNANAFVAVPFTTTNSSWHIHSTAAYCDSSVPSERSTHQVWVRLPGPTRAPTSAPTSPTTNPTAAPTSPTTSPTTAPTSPTTSPTRTTPASCAEYMYWGHTTSGTYTIRAKAGSGLPDRSVYCDMEEDGGGWMLLYSYNRNITDMMYTYRPLDGSHLPTSPTTGYSNWHLGPALGYTSTDDVVDVRFFCETSLHSRVMHFKTSNQHIRRVAVTGSHGDGNSPSHWNTGWIALTNHSALLPAATTYASNDGAFHGYPFQGDFLRWSISDYETQCDHDYMYYYGDIGSSSHQVWVRLAGPTQVPNSTPTSPTTAPTAAPTSPTTSPTAAPTSKSTSPTIVTPSSCAEYMYLGHTASGIYSISAKAGSGLPDRSVYCDMEEDGGGWMLLYSYNQNIYSPYRQINNTHLPTSPTNGYSHWHLGPALGYTSVEDVLDVRFYCSHERHSRVMHFKTSNYHIRAVAVTGNLGNDNSPVYWNTGWTALSHHSAYLPGATTSTNTYGDFADRPFSGNNVQWSIYSHETSCDDTDYWYYYHRRKSSHQIWVRLAGPTKSPSSAPTSPTSTPTAAPTSPTTSPTTTPTSPTSSPTTSPTTVPTSCTEYLYIGHTISGVYTVWAQPGSGLPDRRVYCDMEEDGGGWMLLYSYNRNLTTIRPLDGSHLPKSPTTGYSHVHLTDALGYTSADDVADVRFYCTHSSHSRVMHFKSSNKYIRMVAVFGVLENGNTPQNWTTGWTALTGHSAVLPAGTTYTNNNGAFFNTPFSGYYASWGIYDSYAYCDHYGRSGSSSHQVWVRLQGPTRAPTPESLSPTTSAPTTPTASPTAIAPTTCMEYMFLGHNSGVFTVSAKNGSGLPDRSVYCDMEEDGGGWMLLYSYSRDENTYLALDGSHLPTSPTTGYSHWHLGPALGYTSADDVDDVRLYCSTSRHSRVVHFKTSNYHVREVAVSGSHGSGNIPANWNTGWTALSDHSATLPADAIDATSSGAFYDHPFAGNNGSWSLNSTGGECDDFGGAGAYSFQVWVRLPAPPTLSPTTSSPTSPPTESPTTIPTSMHPTSDQPLKDNWFRKRDVARHESYPQKNSWIRKQANRKSDISNNNAK